MSTAGRVSAQPLTKHIHEIREHPREASGRCARASEAVPRGRSPHAAHRTSQTSQPLTERVDEGQAGGVHEVAAVPLEHRVRLLGHGEDDVGGDDAGPLVALLLERDLGALLPPRLDLDLEDLADGLAARLRGRSGFRV